MYITALPSKYGNVIVAVWTTSYATILVQSLPTHPPTHNWCGPNRKWWTLMRKSHFLFSLRGPFGW